MKAVWSLWTKPLNANRRPGWLTPKHHLLSWVLSFELARQHYRDTQLLTDRDGAALLVDGLGLEFASVSLALDALADHDPDWWAIGKLYAYAAQDAPFVHLDSDVFLWRPLPQRLEHAPLFVQSPEHMNYGASSYRPESIEHDIRRTGGWMPLELDAYIPIAGELKAENCGIVGGTRTDFIRHYATEVIRFIEHPDNQLAWQQRPRRDEDFVTMEQFMLSACVAYHQSRSTSPFCEITVSYLFDSIEGLAQAGEAGFTHLIASSKRDPDLCEHLERVVARKYPERYQRCLALSDSSASQFSTT
ncbi:hypothetical protein ACVWYQ_006408 [Bradyrhizobium sp. USDA 3397]